MGFPTCFPRSASMLCLFLVLASVASAGVSVETMVSVSGIDDFWYEQEDTGAATAFHSYSRWNNQPIQIHGSTWNANCGARVDLPSGILKAWSNSMTYLTEDTSDGVNSANTYAWTITRINDRITFSQPTTIRVRGSFHGNLSAFANSMNGGNADAGASLDISLFNPDALDELEASVLNYSEYWSDDLSYGNGGAVITPFLPIRPDIEETFDRLVEVPAGTLDFYMRLDTWADSTAYVDLEDHGYGSADADLGNTVTFEILVPDDVTVTSETGMLPVTVIPEPATGILLALGLITFRKRK